MPEVAPTSVDKRGVPRSYASRLMPSIGWLLLLLASFLALYGIVTPTEGGDTLRYAADVVRHAHGQTAQFWEFGHLLWRPWGYLGLRTIGPWFIAHYGDSEMQAVTRFFVWTNFLCSLATVLLIWGILRRFVSTPLATAVAIAFCGANGFLGYVTLGSAYIPALCFECLSLWILVTRTKVTYGPSLIAAVAAGVSYAICVLLWFPFSFVGLGMLAALLWWPSGEVETASPAFARDRMQSALVFLLAAAIVSAAGIAAGAVVYGAHGAGDIRKWIVDADNGWSQHLNIVRAGTGVPRSLFELTSGGILLKRWFFHDPYNPVHIPQLAGALLLKLLLFYVGIAVLLLALLKKNGRPTLLVLLCAAVPALFFAVFVFEPGSTSRYVPVLPFLYIAAAIALNINGRRPLIFGALTAVLATVVMFNAVSLGKGSFQAAEEVRGEVRGLDNAMSRSANVFVVTLRDPLYYVPLTRPLDHTLVSQKYTVADVIEIASTRILHWRAEFADRTLQSWEQGRDVWISKKLLAPRPSGDGTWVEGDDPRIHWNALPEFFRQFETDRSEGGADGFVRIADAPANRNILQKLMQDDPGYKSSPFRSL
jgi:hypothetical protein